MNIILFLQKSPWLNAYSPELMLRILKQSINFYNNYFEKSLKFLSSINTFLALFLKIIIGKLLPKSLYISSAPHAIIYVIYSAVSVYFLTQFLESAAYYSNESPAR